jgi:hypothetical protein
LTACFSRSFAFGAGVRMLGGVFINYRREDSGGYPGRIYDRLTSRLGRDSVFFDVDAIPSGRDFADVLSERVGKCDALIAVIGKHWVSSADAQNRHRLEDPNDFVRVEIEAALKRNVPVIPVLVDDAAMPPAEDLPDILKKLTRRQAVEISHTRFDSDAERLTEALSQIEDERRRRDAKATPLTRAEAEAAPRTMEARRSQEAAERPAQAEAANPRSGRSRLVLAIMGMVVVAGVAALLFAQLGSRQEEKAADAASAGATRVAQPSSLNATDANPPDSKTPRQPQRFYLCRRRSLSLENG